MSDDKIDAGEAWQIFAVMKDGKFSGVIAKNPRKPQVQDITEELAKHLHWIKTGGRSA